ncbi:MAG: transglutaminase-like domain-containing protein [Planctomycetota bacterium]|nr:transglutaminase-like domain-containing protein [Planctomycetota bacterium]
MIPKFVAQLAAALPAVRAAADLRSRMIVSPKGAPMTRGLLLLNLAIALGIAAPLAAAEPGLFANLPPGWKVLQTTEVSSAQVLAIGRKLGADLLAVSNTTLAGEGGSVQVNLMRCRTADDAARIHKAVLAAHGGFADGAALRGDTVVEFTGQDIRVIKKAHYALGLRPKSIAYRITFDAAPIDQADYMAWNAFFNLFLARQSDPKDEKVAAQIQALRPKFTFGNQVALRSVGLGGQASSFAFKPAAAQQEALPQQDVIRYTFKDLPAVCGVPCVTVTATVHVEAFAATPTRRKAGPELLGATEFWPVADPEIQALARTIVGSATTEQRKAEALLEWFRPGKNLQFGGAVTGSRWGVKKVLQQRSGHCWDFADCFVTLGRAAGMPCRLVSGWLYGQSGHIWAEVLIEGKGWLQCDPTAGMFCGSDYIPWITTETGGISMVYLSMPHIEFLADSKSAGTTP